MTQTNNPQKEKIKEQNKLKIKTKMHKTNSAVMKTTKSPTPSQNKTQQIDRQDLP